MMEETKIEKYIIVLGVCIVSNLPLLPFSAEQLNLDKYLTFGTIWSNPARQVILWSVIQVCRMITTRKHIPLKISMQPNLK